MAKYSAALEWMLDNDDTDFLDHDENDACGTESVTAALVADLFNRSTAEVRADLLTLRKARERAEQQRCAKLRRQLAARDAARAAAANVDAETVRRRSESDARRAAR